MWAVIYDIERKRSMKKLRFLKLFCTLVLMFSYAYVSDAQTNNVKFLWNYPLVGTPPTPTLWAVGIGAHLYRQTDCTGIFQIVSTVPDANVRMIQDNGLTQGMRYCWYVTAFNNTDESVPSNTVTLTIPSAKPGAPTSVTVELVITIPIPGAATTQPTSIRK